VEDSAPAFIPTLDNQGNNCGKQLEGTTFILGTVPGSGKPLGAAPCLKVLRPFGRHSKARWLACFPQHTVPQLLSQLLAVRLAMYFLPGGELTVLSA